MVGSHTWGAGLRLFENSTSPGSCAGSWSGPWRPRPLFASGAHRGSGLAGPPSSTLALCCPPCPASGLLKPGNQPALGYQRSPGSEDPAQLQNHCSRSCTAPEHRLRVVSEHSSGSCLHCSPLEATGRGVCRSVCARVCAHMTDRPRQM